MRVEEVETLIDFGHTVGLASSIAGATVIIGSIFLNNPEPTSNSFKDWWFILV